jgi:type I restriction enzyme S subunit
LPFDIPDNWTWIRLTSIATISAGGTPDRGIPKYWNGDIPWLKISDVTSANKYVRKASEFITKDGMDNSSAKIMQKGTILYTIFATIGEVGILDFDATCNQAIAGINTHLKEVDDYLYFLLVNLKDYMKSISKGCAQFNINQKILKETLIALPPIEEQMRIVKKLDSFNPLLDSYEIAEEKLSKLEEEFPEKLKKSILQYAIEGKLVKQNPDDEPASVLLERIKTEKERLIKEGKIKRDKNESYIYQGDDKNYYEKVGKEIFKLDDEFILSLPENIEKQRFKTVLDVRDGTHESPSYFSKGYPFISSKNLENGKIDYENIKYISKENFDKYNIRSNAEEDDILFGMIGTIGNPSIIENPPFKFAFKNMALIKVNKTLFDPKYVFYYLLWIERKFKTEATGEIQQFISLDYIRNSLITIPSLSYQNRVVRSLDFILSI